MNTKSSIFLSLFFLSTTAFGNAESPECQYWAKHLQEIEASLAKAQTKLQSCEQSSSDCSDLKRLISSLEIEKSGTESFLKNSCQ